MKQKRSFPLAIELLDIPLDPASPIQAESGHELNDRPITSLHVHSCLELGCCHEGHGVFMVAGKVRNFSTGDVVMIAAGEPHLARGAPGTASRWTWIDLDPVKLVPPGAAAVAWMDSSTLCGLRFLNVFSNAEYPALVRAVFRLAEEFAGDALGRLPVMQAFVVEIMVQAKRLGPTRKSGRVITHCR